MEHYFKKLQDSVSLSNEEKLASFSAIERMMQENPLPTASPYLFASTYFHKHMYAGALGLALLVTGSVPLSAAQALPGDFLYPIKIHFNENIATSLALTDEAKAKVHIELATKRLEEIEAVSEKDPHTNEEDLLFAIASFESHSKLAVEHIGELAEEDTSEALALHDSFEAALDQFEEKEELGNEATIASLMMIEATTSNKQEKKVQEHPKRASREAKKSQALVESLDLLIQTEVLKDEAASSSESLETDGEESDKTSKDEPVEKDDETDRQIKKEKKNSLPAKDKKLEAEVEAVVEVENKVTLPTTLTLPILEN